MMVPITDDLGRRMVLAARLATTLHMHASFLQKSQNQQRVEAGGAGPDFVTDDALPLTGPALPRPALAEGVAE